MQHVSFCYLDAITGEAFDQRTSKGGPVMPVGCTLGFALESQYPTDRPVFYGTTSGPTALPGILSVISKAEYDAAEAAETTARRDLRLAVLSAAVDAERDRRLRAGMTFQGHVFQTDDRSRDRIDRSRGSALAATVAGVQEGDLRWHGMPVDFFWIATDDTRVPMDAQTMLAFGNASAAREGLLIVAGNDLKRRLAGGETIANIADDALWPA